MISPLLRGLPRNPPSAPIVYVDLDPRTAGTSMPPATQRYPLQPVSASPMSITSPLLTHTDRQRGIAAPFTLTSNRPPVKAITTFSRTRILAPMAVTSRPASPNGFLTSKFPICKANRSIAPEGGMPLARKPFLPRSCTVLKIPGWMISKTS